VLMGHALEYSTNEGAALFDMLKGEYEHKKLWTREARVTTHLRVYRRTLPGLLRRLRERKLPPLARFLRSFLGVRERSRWHARPDDRQVPSALAHKQ